MYEKAVGLGLGYLVYKRLMSELAKEPVKEGVKVKAGQLLGWDKPAEFEKGLKLWAGVPDECVVKGGFSVVCPPSKTYKDWLTAGGDPSRTVKQDIPKIDWTTAFPYFEFEPVTKELGRPGLRPKGL